MIERRQNKANAAAVDPAICQRKVPQSRQRQRDLLTNAPQYHRVCERVQDEL